MIYDNEPIKLNSHDPDNLFLMIPIDFKIFLHSFSSIFYFIFQHFLLYNEAEEVESITTSDALNSIEQLISKII